MPTRIEMIESDFMARRTRRPAVAAAFEEAFALAAPAQPTPRCRRLHAIGAAIAAAVAVTGSDAAWVAEPAYHDRHHTIEAMLAMGLLCRVAMMQGLMDGDAAMLGVVGMAGHDLGHDGSILPGGVMEARSRMAVEAILGAMRPVPDAADIDAIGALIAATDPALAPDNAARAARAGRLADRGASGKGASMHHVHHLANEADVFASLMPRLGPRLSQLLAEEWRNDHDASRQEVGTARGRLGFLLHQPPFSDAAAALGLPSARGCCLTAYAAVGAALGTEPNAAAGCAALDRLPPAKARAAYRRALAPLWPRPHSPATG